jgi:hypothetical protein
MLIVVRKLPRSLARRRCRNQEPTKIFGQA